MATDLGKVGIRLRGEWSSAATYEILDAVTYQHGFYIAKQAVPANTAPTQTAFWENVIPAYTTSSVGPIPLDSSNPVAAGTFGAIVAKGGNSGTKVYIRRTSSVAFDEYNIAANTTTRIPIMPGEEVYYTGGAYAAASIFYPAY